MTFKEKFPGLFLVCDGVDGGGKTTNALHLANILRDEGYLVTHTREPGGTPTGEDIREILLRKEGEVLTPKAELLLFAAARELHIEQKIKPALREGRIVLCDRFSISTRVYQGNGRNLMPEVLQLEKFVHAGFYPDYVLFFEVPFDVAQNRLALRSGKSDRLDEETLDFKRKVYNGFRMQKMRLSLEDNEGIAVSIDASGTPEFVQNTLHSWVRHTFNKYHGELRHVPT